MNIKEIVPLMLFDNQCYLCTKFAGFIDFFLQNRLTIIGHYSELGEEIRKKILDESALDMFWLIDKNRAYGGRAALSPLIKLLFTKRKKLKSKMQSNNQCDQECKTVKAVFLRSASLFRNSRIIDI